MSIILINFTDYILAIEGVLFEILILVSCPINFVDFQRHDSILMENRQIEISRENCTLRVAGVMTCRKTSQSKKMKTRFL